MMAQNKSLGVWHILPKMLTEDYGPHMRVVIKPCNCGMGMSTCTICRGKGYTEQFLPLDYNDEPEKFIESKNPEPDEFIKTFISPSGSWDELPSVRLKFRASGTETGRLPDSEETPKAMCEIDTEATSLTDDVWLKKYAEETDEDE